jgi:predicted permease
VPAWRSTRAEIQTTLRDGGRGASGGGGHRTRRLLVAAQTALALVLLVGAGLMTRSFLRLLGVDAGLRTTGLVAVYVSRFVANTSREASVGPYTETYDRVMARLRELPRVIDVGGSYAVPFKDQAEQRPQAAFSVEGQDRREQRQNAPAVWTPVSPSYFETLGIPLLAGRTFRADDTPTSEPVVIVNRSMAKTLWPGREAVGQMLLVGKEGPDNPWNRVVGVVGDTLWNAAEGSGFEIYSSHRQWPVPAFHILVRVDGDPRPLVPLLRRVVQEVEPDLAVNDVKTMDTIVSESLWQRRLWGALLSAFGVGALLLGALGLYSVTSQAVGERTRELGVRMALGARARDVLALVAGEAMGLALAGAGAGVLGALALSQFLRGLLFEVAPTDPLAFGAASGLLVLVALVASLVPAARAARVDPAVCLRRE